MGKKLGPFVSLGSTPHRQRRMQALDTLLQGGYGTLCTSSKEDGFPPEEGTSLLASSGKGDL